MARGEQDTSISIFMAQKVHWQAGSTHLVAHVLQTYKQAGRSDEVHRFHARARTWRACVPPPPVSLGITGMSVEEYWPLPERSSGRPIPRLRSIRLTDDIAELGRILPAGVVGGLSKHWPKIAKAARKLRFYGDAFPKLVTGNQWQRLDLYTQKGGWSEEGCTQVSALCMFLRGKMKSESVALKHLHRFLGSWILGNDECVTIFRLAPHGWAPVHSGQDARVNVHLCLLNCDRSWIRVGNSGKHFYRAGSILAFHDSFDHEVYNEDPIQDRIILHIATYHPDLTLALVRAWSHMNRSNS